MLKTTPFYRILRMSNVVITCYITYIGIHMPAVSPYGLSLPNFVSLIASISGRHALLGHVHRDYPRTAHDSETASSSTKIGHRLDSVRKRNACTRADPADIRTLEARAYCEKKAGIW